MINQENFIRIIKLNLLFILFGFSTFAIAQESDSEKKAYYFGGSGTVTNNGISVLPTFSLGKPAAIFDMKVGKRLTFEPQFRFALDGKPWSFIFWWRYKLIDSKKFSFRIGAHPAILFKTVTDTTYGVTSEIIEAKRYVAADFAPNYQISKNVSVGIYYLVGHGLQDDGVINSNFLTVNADFTHIKLVKDYYLKFNPQFYCLWMDDQNGFYFTSSFSLAKDDFPLSVQSIINQPIQTNITGGEDFIWNISLIYSFGKEYVVK